MDTNLIFTILLLFSIANGYHHVSEYSSNISYDDTYDETIHGRIGRFIRRVRSVQEDYTNIETKEDFPEEGRYKRAVVDDKVDFFQSTQSPTSEPPNITSVQALEHGVVLPMMNISTTVEIGNGTDVNLEDDSEEKKITTEDWGKSEEEEDGCCPDDDIPTDITTLPHPYDDDIDWPLITHRINATILTADNGNESNQSNSIPAPPINKTELNQTTVQPVPLIYTTDYTTTGPFTIDSIIRSNESKQNSATLKLLGEHPTFTKMHQDDGLSSHDDSLKSIRSRDLLMANTFSEESESTTPLMVPYDCSDRMADARAQAQAEARAEVLAEIQAIAQAEAQAKAQAEAGNDARNDSTSTPKGDISTIDLSLQINPNLQENVPSREEAYPVFEIGTIPALQDHGLSDAVPIVSLYGGQFKLNLTENNDDNNITTQISDNINITKREVITTTPDVLDQPLQLVDIEENITQKNSEESKIRKKQNINDFLRFKRNLNTSSSSLDGDNTTRGPCPKCKRIPRRDVQEINTEYPYFQRLKHPKRGGRKDNYTLPADNVTQHNVGPGQENLGLSSTTAPPVQQQFNFSGDYLRPPKPMQDEVQSTYPEEVSFGVNVTEPQKNPESRIYGYVGV